MNTVAIVVACGKEEEIAPGTEAGFLTLGDAPMIARILKTLERTPSVDGIIVAIPKNRIDATMHMVKRYGFSKVTGVVVGGVTRFNTLKIVLAKLPEPVSIVVVHEASRPFASRETFEETIKAAKRYGCAIAAHRLPDAVKTTPKGMKAGETLERNTAWVAQTPQAFRSEVLEKIVGSKTAKVIDDESEFVKSPAEVHMVESGTTNLKIRTVEDLSLATALVNAKLVPAQ